MHTVLWPFCIFVVYDLQDKVILTFPEPLCHEQEFHCMSHMYGYVLFCQCFCFNLLVSPLQKCTPRRMDTTTSS